MTYSIFDSSGFSKGRGLFLYPCSPLQEYIDLRPEELPKRLTIVDHRGNTKLCGLKSYHKTDDSRPPREYKALRPKELPED